MEGRKRIKDQLMRIDSTYATVTFGYADKTGTTIPVLTREQEDYPNYYKIPASSVATAPEEIIKSRKNSFTRTDPTSVSLPELLLQEESQTLEFKSTLLWDIDKNQVNRELPQEVIKTIVAFLNSNPGTLLIGVRDNGELYGLEKDLKQLKDKGLDGFGLRLMDLIHHEIGASFIQYISYRFETIQGFTLCRVDVQPAPEPVFIKPKNVKEFYIRMGNRSKTLDTEQAYKYIKNHWG